MNTLSFWHQSMVELDTAPGYLKFIEEHSRVVLAGQVTVKVHGLRSGSLRSRPSTPGLNNAFVYHRVLDQVIDNALEAQRSGYDAFIVASFAEPYLREIRSVLDIPVLSILESTLLTGCCLGQKLIPICNAPGVAAMVNRAIGKHGLNERVMDAVAIEPALDEPTLANAISAPGRVIDAFSCTARHWLARSADVVVPAEGVLSAVMTANNIVAINGAPVLDVFAIGWRHALMMTQLRQDFGLAVSKVGYYERGDQALIDELLLGQP